MWLVKHQNRRGNAQDCENWIRSKTIHSTQKCQLINCLLCDSHENLRRTVIKSELSSNAMNDLNDQI